MGKTPGKPTNPLNLRCVENKRALKLLVILHPPTKVQQMQKKTRLK